VNSTISLAGPRTSYLGFEAEVPVIGRWFAFSTFAAHIIDHLPHSSHSFNRIAVMRRTAQPLFT